MKRSGNPGLSPPHQVLLISQLAGAYERCIVDAALAWTRQHAHWTVLGYSQMRYEPADLLRAFPQIDGIIVTHVWREAAECLREISVPVVLVEQTPLEGLSVVRSDNFAVGRLAGEHLLGLGYERFAYWGLPEELYSREREAGFRHAIAERGMEVQIDPFVTSGIAAYWSLRLPRLRTLLRSLQKPAAIFCDNLLRARHVLQACHELGLAVPQQIAILGVDPDDVLAGMESVPLSTIDQGCEQIGVHAAHLLQNLMAGDPHGPRQILIPPARLIERQSTSVCVIKDAEVAQAVQLIRQFAISGITIEQILHRLQISRRSLELRFKQSTGQTLHQHLILCRVQQAKRLLRESTMALPDVAAQSGFGSANRMIKVFFTSAGCTPRDYRRRRDTSADEAPTQALAQ